MRSLRVYWHHLQSIPKVNNLLKAAKDTGKDALACGLLTMGTVEVLKKTGENEGGEEEDLKRFSLY